MVDTNEVKKVSITGFKSMKEKAKSMQGEKWFKFPESVQLSVITPTKEELDKTNIDIVDTKWGQKFILPCVINDKREMWAVSGKTLNKMLPDIENGVNKFYVKKENQDFLIMAVMKI